MANADKRQNFETLCRAIRNGDVVLLDCRHRTTGELISVVCATNQMDGGLLQFVPLARMLDANMGEFLFRAVCVDPPPNPEIN